MGYGSEMERLKAGEKTDVKENREELHFFLDY